MLSYCYWLLFIRSMILGVEYIENIKEIKEFFQHVKCTRVIFVLV